MHYYQFNIGDYRRDTSHLTILEHGIYRQLIDSYYLSEGSLEADLDTLMRTHCVRTADEMRAFENVLKDFFYKVDGCLVHKGCERVIAEYHAKSDKAKASANARWSRSDANALRTQSEGNADGMLTNNHKPLTINQEPDKKTKTHRGTRLPADMILSDDWALFCKKERPDLTPNEVFLEFKDYWVAQPGQKGTKTDWDATWRNWVRRQNAKKKGSVWDENERRKQALADRIFGKGRDDGRTIEAATVRLG